MKPNQVVKFYSAARVGAKLLPAGCSLFSWEICPAQGSGEQQYFRDQQHGGDDGYSADEGDALRR